MLALCIALSGSAIALQAGSVRSQHIVDGSVATADLGRGAVKAKQLGRGAVSEAKLRDRAVAAGQLGPGAVDAAHVADGAIGPSKLADDSIGSGPLAAGSVRADRVVHSAITGAKVAPGSLIANRFVNSAVTNAKLAANSIDSAKVVDNSLTGDHISEPALASPLLRGLELRSHTTASTVSATKSDTVSCLAGRVVVGGGVTINPASGTGNNIALTISAPDFTQPSTHWRGVARRIGPADGVAWSLTIRALCALP